jgi:hypothetical protein
LVSVWGAISDVAEFDGKKTGDNLEYRGRFENRNFQDGPVVFVGCLGYQSKTKIAVMLRKQSLLFFRRRSQTNNPEHPYAMTDPTWRGLRDLGHFLDLLRILPGRVPETAGKPKPRWLSAAISRFA